jgi:hypothetical protein
LKLNRMLIVTVGLILGLGFLGSMSWHFLAQKAPREELAAQPEETLPAPALSAEDQGYVDCPEEMDTTPIVDPVPLAQAASCLQDLLPWGQPPAPFHADISLEALQNLCGPVFTDFLFYRGEGRCQWGTAMFQGTDRELEITWHNWKERTRPRSLRFVGPELHFANGMRPGLLLKELAALNGTAIVLGGFGWDDSGAHQSFQKGALQDFDAPESPYQIQYGLDWDLFEEASEAEHASIIVGESTLESTEPALEKFKAQVEYIEYRFQKDDRSMRLPL